MNYYWVAGWKQGILGVWREAFFITIFILPTWHVLQFFAGFKTFSIFLNSFQEYCIKYFDNYSFGLIDKFRFKQGAARIIVLLQKPVQQPTASCSSQMKFILGAGSMFLVQKYTLECALDCFEKDFFGRNLMKSGNVL